MIEAAFSDTSIHCRLRHPELMAEADPTDVDLLLREYYARAELSSHAI